MNRFRSINQFLEDQGVFYVAIQFFFLGYGFAVSFMVGLFFVFVYSIVFFIGYVGWKHEKDTDL